MPLRDTWEGKMMELYASSLTDELAELEEREQRIERNLRAAWYETALDYLPIRKKRLYRLRGWNSWEDYCQERWNRNSNGIDAQIARAIETSEMVKILTLSSEQAPASMSLATELAKLETTADRAVVWQHLIESTGGQGITAKTVQAEVERYKAARDKTYITLTEWNAGQRWHGGSSTKAMNEQDDRNIEWAAWSWNPVTGCNHGCEYCYARDIANRFYPHGFEPTYHPDRLTAPTNTKLARPRWDGDIGYKGVFVCSMADLFGKWVPQEWIDAVLKSVRQSPQWNFIFLTKNPSGLVGIDWPANAWVGTTVDVQARAEPAAAAFAQIHAPVRFLSCEPMRERLTFSSLGMFDWVIIGGQSRTSQAPEAQPEWVWVEDLHNQARMAGCAVYWKDNLKVRPREYPTR